MDIAINRNKLVFNLIELQINIVLYCQFFISAFHFPTAITYLTDAVSLLLAVLTFKRWSPAIREGNAKAIRWVTLVFLFWCIVTAVVNLATIKLFLWAFRNIFRYIAIYMAILAFLKMDDLKKIFRIFITAYWINIPLTLFQFFVQGYRADYLGGTFGNALGCNGRLNVFICIMLAYATCMYLSHRSSICNYAAYVISFFIIATMAELKVCFGEFIIITGTAFFVTGRYHTDKRSLTDRFSAVDFRKAFFIGLAGTGLMVGYKLLSILMPGSLRYLSSFAAIEEYLQSNFIRGLHFTRSNWYEVINQYFFTDNKMRYIFGYGFGNCEYSAYFTSPFWDQFGTTSYRNFSSSMITLQTGYVGMILYVLILIVSFYQAFQHKKKMNPDLSVYAGIVKVNAVFGLVLVFYGCSLMTEVGYLIFAILAMEPVLMKEANSPGGNYDTEKNSLLLVWRKPYTG
jgi:hypothetical protein